MPRYSERALRRQRAKLITHAKPVEDRYVRQLRGVMRAIVKQYQDAVDTHAVERRVHDSIARTVGPLFDRMAAAITKDNAKGMAALGVAPRKVWHPVHARKDSAALIAQALGDPGIAGAIQSARDANIALIEKAGRNYAQDVRTILSDPKNIGARAEDIAAQLVARGNISERHAELVARDQTLKLNGNITKIRQQNAGISEYVWSTAGDQRVRDEHQSREGQTFAWAAPPDDGHPGEPIQCRCVAIPAPTKEEDIFAGLDLPPIANPNAATAFTPDEPEQLPPIAPKVNDFDSTSETPHAWGISNSAKLPDEKVKELTKSLIPDRGHSDFLKRNPLFEVQFMSSQDIGQDNGRYLPGKKDEGTLQVRADRQKGWEHRPLSGSALPWTYSETLPSADAAVEGTLVHEFGHHIHMVEYGSDLHKEVDAVVKQAFQEKNNKGQVAISQYAGTNHMEYFAENYAAWRYTPEALRAHDPIGHGMVEQVLRMREILK